MTFHSDMDAAWERWDKAINAWGKEQKEADQADANYKHWRASAVKAHIDSGMSVAKAEVLVTASEDFVEKLGKVTSANVKAEVLKKKITLANADFDKERSKFSATKHV